MLLHKPTLLPSGFIPKPSLRPRPNLSSAVPPPGKSTCVHVRSRFHEFRRFDRRLNADREFPAETVLHAAGNHDQLESVSEDKQEFEANYIPLSPLSFIERAAVVYGDLPSVIDGSRSYTWKETHQRCLRLASALTHLGISRRDVVAVLAPNVPATYELHFGVPMAGAVLCLLNTRHDSAMISYLLKHSGTKVLFVDHQLLEKAQGALKLLSESSAPPPVLVTISEPGSPTTSADMDYENLIATADPHFEIRWPVDELEPISINYTSGTTSKPKGVVYTHRGAYLNAISAFVMHEITSMPVYLWTVPMFHCNGWCLTWGIAAQGGTNICIRNVTAKGIFDRIALHKVTYMGGAPTVLNSIVNSPDGDQKPLPHRVVVMTGGSSPPPHVLFKMEELGFTIIHMYGLTEVGGPATACTWKPEWESLPAEEKAKIKSRQGLHHIGIEVDVKDPITMKSVPFDGKTMGEVMFRGNTVMTGYYKDPEATDKALAGGWFRSGDLAVRHSDGYVHVKDRSKDIIISGGENISTVEVEAVLFAHPAVFEAAVVARPDEHWGETPCAFVKLKEGCKVSSEEIVQYCCDSLPHYMEYCRDSLPHYMAPKTVVFEEIPKTSTGKVQKYVLRERAKAMGSISKVNGALKI